MLTFYVSNLLLSAKLFKSLADSNKKLLINEMLVIVIIIEFIPIVVIMPLNERAVCKHCYKIFCRFLSEVQH